LEVTITGLDKSVERINYKMKREEEKCEQLALEFAIASDIYHDNLSLYAHADCEKVQEATAMCKDGDWDTASREKLLAIARELNRMKWYDSPHCPQEMPVRLSNRAVAVVPAIAKRNRRNLTRIT